MKLSKSIIVISSIFCPFLVILAAFVLFPGMFKVAILQTSSYGWIWIILFALFALFVIYLVTYIQSQTSMRGVFNKLDIDHDGYISEKEAHSYKDLNKVFKRFDKSHHGYLNRREFARAVRETVNVPDSSHGGV
jgi:hypothetical protein